MGSPLLPHGLGSCVGLSDYRYWWTFGSYACWKKRGLSGRNSTGFDLKETKKKWRKNAGDGRNTLRKNAKEGIILL